MKLDLHVHTQASFDCESAPRDILRWAIRKGLDGIAVTEHDSTEGFQGLERAAQQHNLLVIPAVEATVRRGTHYLVYLTPELPLPTDDLELIEEVHRRGGAVGAPHPYRSDTGLLYNQLINRLYDDKEVDVILKAIDLIEVSNAKSSADENRRAVELAAKYPRLAQIAGSDSHIPATVGASHTEIHGFAVRSVREMSEQLKALPRKIIRLPELEQSATERTVADAVEGTRRLMVRFKPVIPTVIWRAGKTLYRNSAGRLADRRAIKSLKK